MRGKKKRLPVGWKWIPLGGRNGLSEIINGSTPSTDIPEYWNGDILWATPSDLGDLRTIYCEDTEKKITVAGLDSCSTTILPIGTVLLTSRAPVGNLAITKKPMCTNQGFKSFVPRDGVNGLYLYFAIKNIVPEIQKLSHGNTFTEITKELVQNVELPLPPTLNDQIRIANELERKMSEVEEMRNAALRQREAVDAMPGAVLRKVFPYTVKGVLSKGWKWDKLVNVCTVNPKRKRGFSRDPKANTSFVPMEAVDEKIGKIIKMITRPYQEISKGFVFFNNEDVIFAKITPCMQNGKSAIVDNLIDGIGFGSTEFHVLRPKSGIAKEWLFHFIRTNEFRKRAADHFTGSAGQQRVPAEFVENSLIPIPPTYDDQIRIVNEIAIKMAQIEKMRQATDRQLEAVEVLSGAILREVFDFEEAEIN